MKVWLGKQEILLPLQVMFFQSGKNFSASNPAITVSLSSTQLRVINTNEIKKR